MSGHICPGVGRRPHWNLQKIQALWKVSKFFLNNFMLNILGHENFACEAHLNWQGLEINNLTH